MKDKTMNFRHIMLFYYKKGKNASETSKKICSINGGHSVAESTVRKWFSWFRSKNIGLEDRHRCSKPSIVDDDPIKSIIENDPHETTRSIAEKLQLSHMSVGRHLKKLGYINRYDVWLSQFE